jgi:hypothetical protein
VIGRIWMVGERIPFSEVTSKTCWHPRPPLREANQRLVSWFHTDQEDKAAG